MGAYVRSYHSETGTPSHAVDFLNRCSNHDHHMLRPSTSHLTEEQERRLRQPSRR